MMDFDQMMDAWRAQDDKPLYGVNRDLLQLVLRHEQANIRRTLRWELWVAYIVGTGMAIFGGVWLWVLIYTQGPALQTVAAGVGTGAFVLWLGAFWVSRRRQAQRERGFGNTLQEEVRRNLSLVEYQIANGRWAAAMMWSAPALVGGGLIYWLMVEINLDPGESRWEHAWMIVVITWAAVFLPYAGSRAVKKKLEPRRQRLRELRDMLNVGE